MALFGGGETAQILMQGVQLLNNTLAQAQQLQMQKEQQDRMFKVQSDELALRAKTLEHQAKFDELDASIKKLQLTKGQAELEAMPGKIRSAEEAAALRVEKDKLDIQLKQQELDPSGDKASAAASKKRLADLDEQLKAYHVEQNISKSIHLKLASEDPVELNRRFQSVGELSDYRDSISKQMNQPLMLDSERAELQKELNSVDQSLRYRIQEGAKQFSKSREELLSKPDMSMFQGPTQETAPAASAVGAAQSGLTVDVKTLVSDVEAKGEKAVTSRQTIRQLFLQRQSAGDTDGVRIFINRLGEAAPGATTEEKAKYIRNLLQGE